MTAGKYREIIRRVESRLGIKVLVPEYEVASFLFDAVRITPLEMQRSFSGSNATLFKILRSLESRNVLRAEANPDDLRSKFYRLSDEALLAFNAQWDAYRKFGPVTAHSPDDKSKIMLGYSRNIYESLRLRRFTCDFQVLVYIYASPGIANGRFHELIEASSAKFNASVAKLKELGLIYFHQSAADKRRRLYYLSDDSQLALDEMTDAIFEWLDSMPAFLEAVP
ncbi:hypothetical protein [Novosphingobium album (ex Hu et al. 2023)]|uniref:MarR family transcriptional regulator n=1 Tax=Novosphingobium album (ex Hu et al. 2023) TaxID=2930093 RepID=A0ABT0AZ08_9SPHN|nr:hypothetical protein [Novosphingobium album (ex Hu et al. 2023)]MCJ2178028.1 hypothetical protein [Novosphingobium album (ex Hu et al. 2023)]